MSNTKQAAVIGAGISGLATAYWLQQEGYEVDVFDRDANIGGAIVTEEEAGFLIDLGPNSTLETSATLTELVAELGLGDEKVYGNRESNKRYIVRDGKLHALPTSPLAFLRTPLFSFAAKLRLLREPFIRPSQGDDISLSDLVRHRLGQEFLDYAINPFVAGVYAGDPDDLSAPAAFPKLYDLERDYGSFIRGAIGGARARKKRKEVAKDRAQLFSFRKGMSVFPQALAAKLAKPVFGNCEITSLHPSESGYQLTGSGNIPAKKYAVVVLTTPTDSLSTLLEPFDATFAGQLREVRYPPVSVVFLGYRQEQVRRELDGFGFLIPKLEQRKILGAIWSSAIFPGRAPDGHAAFTVFVGGTRQPEMATLPEAELLATVVAELNDFVGLSGQPVVARTRLWPRAIPQYTMGYGRLKDRFSALEGEYPGLYFAGNFRRGISVGDSVLSARETVDKIRMAMP
jgi:oxygen-dependent protoporphyrinogen oxidase